ncbi:MAG: fibronectin type III domain-containing protein, partial [Bacteroidales bacterium]|nr:fibronectin type III domain-containing protein [Bacteroidales bacterium]
MLLIAALVVPWATQAQTLESYGFTTGIDASKWVDMTSATQILSPSASDGLASSVESIGFEFPFGASTYTQYSVNTDGNLRLGSTVTGVSNYSTPFSSTNANINNPKINAFGCDGYGVSGSHYVKALAQELTGGDSLLVVEFCMGTYNNTTRNELYKWQIHLYSDGNIEIVFPDATGIPTAGPNVVHQCGICASSSDGWVISSSTNTAQHFTAGSSVTNATGTWFDANRYYSFIHPSNISCPAPTGITVNNITNDGATFSWTAGGNETSWEVIIDDDSYIATTTSYTVTGLDANTTYVVSVRAICGTGDTSFASSASFRTACNAISQLPYSNDFENEPYYLSGTTSYAEAFPYCWHRINDATGTYNYYPYINSSTTYLIHGSKSMYWYHATSDTYADNQYAILPAIDLDAYSIDDLTLTFWAKTTATAAPWPLFIVGVMTDPTDATTFVPVDTITLTNNATMYIVSLANYSGTGNYIAIRSPRTTSARYFSLDDIYLIDAWCDMPGAAVASSTLDEVTISWESNGGS